MSQEFFSFFLQTERGSAVGEENHWRKEGGDQKAEPQQPGETRIMWLKHSKMQTEKCRQPENVYVLPTEGTPATERSEPLVTILNKPSRVASNHADSANVFCIFNFLLKCILHPTTVVEFKSTQSSFILTLLCTRA